MSDYHVPYVAGHSTASVSPPAATSPGYPPAHTPTMSVPLPGRSASTLGAAVAAVPAGGPVVVGEPVDLAHELGQLRRLQMTNMVLLGITLVLALAAVVFSGFVALELWRFLGALQKAFG